MEVMITIDDYLSSIPAAAATTYSRPLDALPCFGQHNAALVPSMLVSSYSTPNDGSNLEEVKHEEEKLKEEKGEEETNDEKKIDGDKNGNKEASHSGSEDDDGDDADSDELDESDDDTMDSTDIEQDLGQAGKPFTKGEIRAMAKHIMSTPGWYAGNKDWHTFGDKVRYCLLTCF